MSAIVIYESLTGNTRRAAAKIADELVVGGVGVGAVCPVTAIDYEALAAADLVVFGTWVDGLVLFGQRPGGKVRQVPALAGKRAAAFCTYAVDPGHTLAKMDALLADRGADPLGGYAINRRKLTDGSKEFVDRLLGVVQA
ncbi:MAG: hypothetical protein JWM05_2480 [Acidimicrobiales bacterium]|nr:hypothetical protein [Acidimicrobiales bacterium]